MPIDPTGIPADLYAQLGVGNLTGTDDVSLMEFDLLSDEKPTDQISTDKAITDAENATTASGYPPSLIMLKGPDYVLVVLNEQNSKTPVVDMIYTGKNNQNVTPQSILSELETQPQFSQLVSQTKLSLLSPSNNVTNAAGTEFHAMLQQVAPLINTARSIASTRETTTSQVDTNTKNLLQNVGILSQQFQSSGKAITPMLKKEDALSEMGFMNAMASIVSNYQMVMMENMMTDATVQMHLAQTQKLLIEDRKEMNLATNKANEEAMEKQQQTQLAIGASLTAGGAAMIIIGILIAILSMGTLLGVGIAVAVAGAGLLIGGAFELNAALTGHDPLGDAIKQMFSSLNMGEGAQIGFASGLLALSVLVAILTAGAASEFVGEAASVTAVVASSMASLAASTGVSLTSQIFMQTVMPYMAKALQDNNHLNEHDATIVATVISMVIVLLSAIMGQPNFGSLSKATTKAASDAVKEVGEVVEEGGNVAQQSMSLTSVAKTAGNVISSGFKFAGGNVAAVFKAPFTAAMGIGKLFGNMVSGLSKAVGAVGKAGASAAAAGAAASAGAAVSKVVSAVVAEAKTAAGAAKMAATSVQTVMEAFTAATQIASSVVNYQAAVAKANISIDAAEVNAQLQLYGSAINAVQKTVQALESDPSHNIVTSISQVFEEMLSSQESIVSALTAKSQGSRSVSASSGAPTDNKKSLPGENDGSQAVNPLATAGTSNSSISVQSSNKSMNTKEPVQDQTKKAILMTLTATVAAKIADMLIANGINPQLAKSMSTILSVQFLQLLAKMLSEGGLSKASIEEIMKNPMILMLAAALSKKKDSSKINLDDLLSPENLSGKGGQGVENLMSALNEMAQGDPELQGLLQILQQMQSPGGQSPLQFSIQSAMVLGTLLGNKKSDGKDATDDDAGIGDLMGELFGNAAESSMFALNSSPDGLNGLISEFLLDQNGEAKLSNFTGNV